MTAETEAVHTVNVPPTMDEEETRWAELLYEAIQRSTRESPRSQQAGRFQVGVSDLGFCPERTRRMLDGQTPDDTDMLLAWIGTALGDHAERAVQVFSGLKVIRQAEVELTMRFDIDGKPFSVRIPGHPDLVFPDDPLMLDCKTDYLLADSERHGPSRQQEYQRHIYGLAAWEAGLFGAGVNLEDVKVGNFWIDRSGQDKRLHVNIVGLDLGVIDEARDWLQDVIYHQVAGEEAEKVPPRDMCEVVCGYYRTCRMFDTDVEGVLTDEETVQQVLMYDEGREMEKAGKRLKDAAKVKLDGQVGTVRAGERLFSLRSTFVNPVLVEEYVRNGYTKIDLREVKTKAPTKRVRKQ